MAPIPSNPRLMTRVLNAVKQLGEGKGSTARDILDLIRSKSKTPPRNLTMQIQRALKHAINAGLLRHRSGRYKALFTLNPTSGATNVKDDSKDRKSTKRTTDPDHGTSTAVDPTGGKHDFDPKYSKESRQDRKRKRSQSKQGKRKGRRTKSRGKRDSSMEYVQEAESRSRKSRYKEMDKRDQNRPAQTKYKHSGKTAKHVDMANATISRSNHKRARGRTRDPEVYSDSSDSSVYETRSKSRKHTQSHRAVKKTTVRQEQKKHDARAPPKRRSVSKSRSPPRQQRQQNPQEQLQLQPDRSFEKVEDNGMECEHRVNADDNAITLNQGVENNCEPNNSGSGSTL